jgi:hypothetical protein
MSTNRDDGKGGEGCASLERRDFLRGLGLATGTAAVAAAPVVLSTPAEANETPEEQAAKRYQETDHVRRFYALNRL